MESMEAAVGCTADQAVDIPNHSKIIITAMRGRNIWVSVILFGFDGFIRS